MGSSGGSANPMFLSQGGVPMPNIPIAGQAGELKPQERGAFQSFLPDLPAAGGGPAPSATGLTSEMLQYRSPQGVVVPGGGGGAAPAASGGGGNDLRSQLAAVAAEGGGAEFGLGGATNTWGGGAGDFGGWGGGGGNGQFGAARGDSGGRYDGTGTGAWNYATQGYGQANPYNYPGFNVAHPVGADPAKGQVSPLSLPGIKGFLPRPGG